MKGRKEEHMQKDITQRSNIWGIHFAFWIVIISFSAYFAALSFNGMYMLQRSLVFIAGNIALFYACYSWIFPDFILRKKIVKGLLLLFLIVLIVIITRFYGDAYLMDKFGRAPEFDFPIRRRILLMLLGETVFAGFAGLVRMTVSVYENKKRMNELEKLQLNTELQFLKSQMSPHFLFNSINNIYSLVLMKSDNAPEALMKLSELLRYTLYNCHDKVLLQQEIEAIESYIDLFRLKFEEEVQLTIKNKIEHVDLMIEPLLFLPIIENAFKYSEIGFISAAFINILMYEDGQHIVLNVKNSIGKYNKTQSSSGIGLANIEKRLEALYKNKYEFIINETENSFETTLKIQLI